MPNNVQPQLRRPDNYRDDYVRIHSELLTSVPNRKLTLINP